MKKEERISVIYHCYQTDKDIIKLRNLYRTKHYSEALQRLILYIERLGDLFHLTLCIMDGNIVADYLNDYPVTENHCVIRSTGHTLSQFKKIEANAMQKTGYRLKKKIESAEKKSHFLLLADKLKDDKKMFRELFHELNAWLCSECYSDRWRTTCEAGDWRSFIPPAKQHRLLDDYIFGRNEAPSDVVLQGQIVKLLYYLSSVGLLQSFVPVKNNAGGHLYMSTTKRSRGRYFKSYGVSFRSRELAMVKCLAEQLERLATRWDEKIPLHKMSSAALGDGNYFTGYCQEAAVQKPIGWVSGWSMTDGKEVLIPAQFVYNDYQKYHPEVVLSPFTAIGSGVAAGQHRHQVILNAVYELIERDALVTGYLNRTVPIQLEKQSLMGTSLGFFTRVLTGKAELHLLDITNDLEVPTYMSLIVSSGKPAIVAYGVKSNLDPFAALYGAVEESYLVWTIKSGNIKSIAIGVGNSGGEGSIPAVTYENYKDLFLTSTFFTAFEYSEKRKLYEKEEYEKLLRKLMQKGYALLYKDITPTWIRPASYMVYRVFIPALQPLYFTKNQEWINHERLVRARKYFLDKKTASAQSTEYQTAG